LADLSATENGDLHDACLRRNEKGGSPADGILNGLPVLLSVRGLKKEFSDSVVLDGVDFRLDGMEKVALVGRNGCGKTTLLRILTGEFEATAGSVQWARGAKVGYLSQHAGETMMPTVWEEARRGVLEQMEAHERLSELEKRLEQDPTEDELEEYQRLHDHFLNLEGYAAERELRNVLSQLGFTEDEYEKPTSALSGGERTRLALSRLLLEEPDLLILDEPTNHLDLSATEWLESWISNYRGAVLLVSHDRTFLANTAQRFLEMRDGTVKAYPGPMEKYLKVKAEDEARLAEVARRQALQAAKLDEYVRRFMNSQRTAQARGRLKQLERLREVQVSAPKAERGMAGGFGKVERSGDIVLEAKGLGMAFGDERLFKDLDWTVRNGERWGVIGENGSGKSTLLKIMLGDMEPTEGRTRIGARVVAGYFRQDAEDLDPEMTPLEFCVWELDMMPPEARNLLARFLITGDDVMRPIATLSGGERNKLSLAKLTHQSPNLLVLDEPTNHLDMDSRDALVEVLRDYKGTLVLISHDRQLLSLITDHTLDMRRSGPILFPGSYADYRHRQAKEAQVAAATAAKPVATQAAVTTVTLSPRELSKEIQRLERELETAEETIHAKEEELKAVEAKLGDPVQVEDLMGLTKRHGELQVEIESAMGKWAEIGEKLEEARAMQGRA
jgi:ATP-binding cassette subfamily F protein 3